MKRYKNLSGRSNISLYEIGDDSIKVKLNDGSVCSYTSNKHGHHVVATMKILAVTGKGLSSFIQKEVKKNPMRTVKQ